MVSKQNKFFNQKIETMPLPLAPVITAGAALLGQGVNAYSQGRVNKKTREWNEKMYGIQRQDALADWQMQNAYNSPAAQMERLRAAGLNPNLVYGHGADAQGGVVRSTDVKGWNPQAPQFDLGSVSGQYFNTQMQQAQIDLLEQQMTLREQELRNKIAQEYKTYADTLLAQEKRDETTGKVQLQGVKLQYAPRVAEMSLQGMKAAIEKTQQDTKLSEARTTSTLDENERRAIISTQTVEQNAIRILQMRLDYWYSTQISPANLEYRAQQIELIKEQIKKVKNDANQSGEKARILNSTPDYWGQQGIGLVKDIVGNIGKKGLTMNPKSTKAPPYKPAPLGGYKYGKNSKTWEPDDWEPNR